MAQKPAGKIGSRDMQVVTLLNELGDRLIRSERERIELKKTVQGQRDVVSELQSRAAQAERSYSSLRQRQEKLEQDYRLQMQRIEKAAVLAEKIENALAQQDKFARRLEKFTEDKARMIRKLERIEETVLETREALNAGALVPLAEQVPAAKSPASEQDSSLWRQWWQNPSRRRMAGVAAGVVLVALFGIGLKMGMPISGPAQPESSFAAVEAEKPETPVQDTARAGVMPPPAAPEIQTPPMPQAGNTNETLYVETPPPPAKPLDPMTMGDEELLAAMKNDPAALAAALNAIEPTEKEEPAKPQDIKQDIKPAPETVAQPVKPAPVKTPVPPAGKTPVPFDVEKFMAGQVDPRPVSGRIARDAALPDMIKDIERQAFEGMPEAQHDLAAIYTAGHGGIPVDYSKAALWFKEAAVNGVANARYNLGVLYHQGLGVKKDVATAVAWYRAAAALDHPEAQYNLGIAYIEGIGAPQDPQTAGRYFEQAARGGIVEAAYNLGLVYENGLIGKGPDFKQSVFWYKIAANQGNKDAQSALDQVAAQMKISAADVETIFDDMKAKNKWSSPSPSAPAQATKVAAPVKPETVKTEKATNNVRAAGAVPVDTPPLAVSAAALPAAPEIMDQSSIVRIQRNLMQLGLYPGPADGVTNPQMTDSIRAYQSRYNLPADGRVSAALLAHMVASLAPAAGAVDPSPLSNPPAPPVPLRAGSHPTDSGIVSRADENDGGMLTPEPLSPGDLALP